MINKAISKLQEHKLRKTSVRVQVLELFISHKGEALSSINIEENLKDIDRITLYRTLKSFEKYGLIHQAIDRTGKTKYALCEDTCGHTHHEDKHAHFHCVDCGTTQCLDSVLNSNLDIPPNYKVTEVHLLVEGVCASCNT